MQEVPIKVQLKENLIKELTKKFLPFHNLLKTKQIDQNIDCAEKNKKDPLNFFRTYRSLQLEHESSFKNLEEKIETCEIQNEECLSKCEISFNENTKELSDCYNDCFSKLNVCANIEYGSFYKSELEGMKQWRSIKKNLN